MLKLDSSGKREEEEDKGQGRVYLGKPGGGDNTFYHETNSPFVHSTTIA